MQLAKYLVGIKPRFTDHDQHNINDTLIFRESYSLQLCYKSMPSVDMNMIMCMKGIARTKK